MFCPKCGNEVDDSFEFCPKCGYSFNQVVPNQPINTQKPIKDKKYGIWALCTAIVVWVFLLMVLINNLFANVALIILPISIILCCLEIKNKKHKITNAFAAVLNVLAITLIVYAVVSTSIENNQPKGALIPQYVEKTSTTKTNLSQSQKPVAQKSNTAFDDDIIDVDISRCHLTYLKHEIGYNTLDEKCLLVYYEFSNHADENKAFGYTISDKAFQNGIELQSSFYKVDDDIQDNNYLEIKPNVSLTVCSAFVLSDESDVELEVSQWISDKISDKMLLSVLE